MITQKQVELRNKLFALSESKFRNFNEKICCCQGTIGVRMGYLRDIAKDLADNEMFFLQNEFIPEYYEEIMIKGLTIGYLKLPFPEILNELDKYIPYITSWSLCDSPCMTIKIFKKNLEEGFEYINKLLSSDKEFYVRVGLVLLLSFYINDKYIDKVLDISTKISLDYFYVKMANSWLISCCYIHYPEKTLELFNNNSLDDFTHNKAISKICDSYRVNDDDKKLLRNLRRKTNENKAV